MVHRLSTTETQVERHWPWEYIQRTMAKAGLGLWRVRPAQLDRLELIVSDSFLVTAGYARADFPTDLSAGLTHFVHPQDALRLSQFVVACIAARKADFQTRFRLRHGRTGKWRWLEIFGEVSGYDDDGRPLDIFGCAIDVHETSAQNETLERQSAERNRILDDIRQGVKEFLDEPGRRRDELQKSLHEDLDLQLELLNRGGEDADEYFSRYLAQAFQLLGNELVWYKAVLDNLPFPTSVFDQDRRWTYLNPPAAQAMGGQVSDYLGRHYHEGWRNFQDSRELDDNDELHLFTFTRQLKNPRRVLSGRNALLEDNHGRAIGAIETLLDVTKAFEAEERTRLMLDANPLACVFFNRDGALMDCNRAAAALCGLPSKRSFLDNFWQTLPSARPDGRDVAATFKTGISQAFQEGQAYLPEMALLAADGTEIPGEMFFRRMEWRDDYTVLGYFHDLRHLRAAQEKLERERLLLRDILDGCPVPFFILAHGAVQFSTPFAKADLGLEAGSSLSDLTVDSRELTDLECELASRKAVNWRPLKLRKPDGSISENLLNAYAAGFEGRPALMVWLMDVTQLRRNERELSAARDQAEASTRAKNDFLANISHEIRTPMNAIIGFNKLLQETELDTQQREFAEKAHSAAKALLHLLNDTLDFSHLESGKLKLAAQDFHLQNVLKNAVELVFDRVKAKGLEFMVLVAPDTPVALVGDEYRLLQTLNYILDNAVKFTERGEISLTVETMAETETEAILLFMVHDTGLGIDRQRIKGLFEPFTQADASSTRRHGGSGLGLTISKKLVNMMDGEIWGESELGQGSSFGFTARFGRHNRTERFLIPHQNFSGLTALVVDDHKMSRDILGKYFKAFGFEVHSSASGEEALGLAKQFRAEGRLFDLAVVDLILSDWDGLETARRLAESSPAGETRPQIVLTTTYPQAEITQTAAEIGIKTVLEKPFSADTLEMALGLLFKTGAPLGPGEFPLSAEERAKKMARAAKGRDASEMVRHLVGARILLVEDNEVNQMVAQRILKKAGLEVSVANNGQEALDMVEAANYDLILMDIQMPVMDGLTATKAIRRLPQGAVLPIVALTTHARPEDREDSFSAGMNDHLTKPLDVNGLFHCLGKWIKPGPGGKAEA